MKKDVKHITLPVKWIYAGIGLMAFCLFLFISSLVYSTLLSRKLITYSDTINKNKKQSEVISSFSLKKQAIEKEIDELVERDNELRLMLGLKSWQKKMRLTTKIKSDADIDKKLAERKTSQKELKKWVSAVKEKMGATPSSWPIRGKIASFFGYRAAPWFGFHSGVDITARYGAPAKAAADGTVVFVGWRNGYGMTVEIAHANGFSTLYAHNSKYAVAVGQKIKRGDVVCYVGTTGWTTGPHLHYEVQRFGKPLNPTAFLDLSLLSASRVWR